MTIRAGIVGYGNLGRSVEKLVKLQPDMELVGIFSRRTGLDTDTPVLPAERAAEHAGEIDVLFLCLGSATDIRLFPDEGVAHVARRAGASVAG